MNKTGRVDDLLQSPQKRKEKLFNESRVFLAKKCVFICNLLSWGMGTKVGWLNMPTLSTEDGAAESEAGEQVP